MLYSLGIGVWGLGIGDWEGWGGARGRRRSGDDP